VGEFSREGASWPWKIEKIKLEKRAHTQSRRKGEASIEIPRREKSRSLGPALKDQHARFSRKQQGNARRIPGEGSPGGRTGKKGRIQYRSKRVRSNRDLPASPGEGTLFMGGRDISILREKKVPKPRCNPRGDSRKTRIGKKEGGEKTCNDPL